MKKNEIIFLGVIITIVILGLLIYWYWRTIPSDTEISSTAKLVKPADKNILIEKASQEIDNLQVSPQTSATAPANYNNEDPFF